MSITVVIYASCFKNNVIRKKKKKILNINLTECTLDGVVIVTYLVIDIFFFIIFNCTVTRRYRCKRSPNN